MKDQEIKDLFINWVYDNGKERLKKIGQEIKKGRATIDLSSLQNFCMAQDIDFWKEFKEEPEKIYNLIINCFIENDTLKLFLESYVVPDTEDKKTVLLDFVREILVFDNFPEDIEVHLEDCFLPKYDGKLVKLEGRIQYVSHPQSYVKESVYQCPKCDFVRTVKREIFQTNKEKRLYCEACEKHRVFVEIEKKQKREPYQLLKLVEPMQTMATPTSVAIILFGKLMDTTDPMKKRYLPGKNVTVIGFVAQVGNRAMVKAICINVMGDISVEITENDVKKIKRLSNKDNILELLVDSFCPGISGLNYVKESTLLQLVGGNEYTEGGVFRRKEIHQLWCGEPATGKSTINLYLQQFFPRCVYITSGNITKVGLGFALEKDPDLGIFLLKGGALVQASSGLLIIDEFEAIKKEHLQDLKTALSQQQINLAKAGIVATMKINTPLIAVMNPQYGYFDAYIPYIDQVKFSDKTDKTVILQRFDLLWAIKDIIEMERDEKISNLLLGAEQPQAPIKKELLLKYILYARQQKPVINEDVKEEMRRYYLALREKSKEKEINITPRVLETMRRLTESIAKLRLKKYADMEDFKESKRLLVTSLKQFGFVPETGEISIPMTEGRLSKTQLTQMEIIGKVFTDLKNVMNKQPVPKQDLVSEVNKMYPDLTIFKIEQLITKMKNEGILFEIKPGFLEKV
ncbi:MAG: ATP-binding protein [Candidatus Hydrothermarchaeota archaeon]